jgi:DNA-binding NarL/FixJ family response regulator
MNNIRVLIVDDHAILRDGIRSLLERHKDIMVVGEAGNGYEALLRVKETLPDIVLMDIAMPQMDGIEATRRIKESYPQVRVLILTQHDDREYIRPLLQAGASGYVLKRSGGLEVLNAIRNVYEQGVFLEPSITRQVVEDYVAINSQKDEGKPHLTEREREVLNLVVDGKSNKEIAQILKINLKTVSVHRSNLMSKLDVHNSIELVRVAAHKHLLG